MDGLEETTMDINYWSMSRVKSAINKGLKELSLLLDTLDCVAWAETKAGWPRLEQPRPQPRLTGGWLGQWWSL